MSVRVDPDTLQVLLRLKLFSGFNEYELARLMGEAEWMEAEPGRYLISEGDQGHELFVLLSGEARITKSSLGMQKVIQKLSPGECFGEMSLIDCRARSASVKTITHCKLLRFDGDHVIAMPKVSSKIYRNLAVMLSQRLRHANDILALG